MIGITPQEWQQRRNEHPKPQTSAYVYVAPTDMEQRALTLIASRLLSTKELGKALNVSERTCWRLTKQLKDKGLITQNTTYGAYTIKEKGANDGA
jgi:biotin operon repressor